MKKEAIFGVAGLTAIAATVWICEMKFISVKKANGIIDKAFAENRGCFTTDDEGNYRIFYIEKVMPWDRKGFKDGGA